MMKQYEAREFTSCSRRESASQTLPRINSWRRSDASETMGVIFLPLSAYLPDFRAAALQDGATGFHVYFLIDPDDGILLRLLSALSCHGSCWS